MENEGFEAAIPTNATAFDENLIVSCWSQRHIAYAAGLGTFGMNNILISAKGCCGRINSVVTEIPTSLIPTFDPITEKNAYSKKTEAVEFVCKDALSRPLNRIRVMKCSPFLTELHAMNPV